MRLLNTTTGELRSFDRGEIPAYAILSHVWGKDEQTHHDVEEGSRALRSHSHSEVKSFLPVLSEKLRRACEFAAKLGIEWIWVDTCCIDKASSAELTEAINSMFRWYAQATVCIAYLADVPDGPRNLDESGSVLWTSRWFTRGWTLQELIAPQEVILVSRGWKRFGNKRELAKTLEAITGVDKEVLLHNRALSEVCIAERMSWAAKRETTRIEDKAYSLQGIFGVHMPTLYGEGKNAFRRLQEELLRVSSDQTLFAWGISADGCDAQFRFDFFADEPSKFLMHSRGTKILPLEEIPQAVEAFLSAIEPTPQVKGATTAFRHSRIPRDMPTYVVSNYGIRARVPIIFRNPNSAYAIAVLAMKYESSYVGLILCPLSTEITRRYATGGPGRKYRIVLVGDRSRAERSSPGAWVKELDLAHYDVAAKWEDIYIDTSDASGRHQDLAHRDLTIMNRELRRNICNIDDHSLTNDEVPDLEQRLNANVPEELQNACKQWPAHLCQVISPGPYLLRELDAFVDRHILYWLESLSLMGCLHIALTGLPKAVKWVSRNASGSQLEELLRDVDYALRSNYDLISTSASQIYHATLVFMPDCTLYRKTIETSPPPIKLLSSSQRGWSPVLKKLNGHSCPVLSMAFLPDTGRLVSGHDDGTVRIWNTHTLVCAVTLNSPHGQVHAVACSRDGNWIASGGERMGVALWDAQTGALLRTLAGQKSTHFHISFSRDNSFIVAGSSCRSVRMWAVGTGKTVGVSRGYSQDRVRSLAFSPGGEQVAFGSCDGSIKILDLETGTPVLVLKGHTAPVRSLTLSPEGQRIVSGSGDHTIGLWDAETGHRIRSMEGHTEAVVSVALAADGSHIISCSHDGTIRKWDTSTGECIGASDLRSPLLCMVSSPDESWIAVGQLDGGIAILDATALSYVKVGTERHVDRVTSITIAPGGEIFASSSWDRTVRVWKTRTGEHLRTIQPYGFDESKAPYNVNVVLFSPDGTVLASGSGNSFTVELFRTTGRWERCALLSVPHQTSGSAHSKMTSPKISSLAFSADSSHLACGGRSSWPGIHEVAIWDTFRRKRIALLRDEEAVSTLAFAPDMTRIAAAGDGSARIWDISSGERIVAVTSSTTILHSLTFTPDGGSIVFRGVDGSIAVQPVPLAPTVSFPSDAASDEAPPRFSWDSHYKGGGSFVRLRYNTGIGEESKPVCWFPIERRPYSDGRTRLSYAWHHNIVVVGSESGIITVLDVSEVVG